MQETEPSVVRLGIGNRLIGYCPNFLETNVFKRDQHNSGVRTCGQNINIAGGSRTGGTRLVVMDGRLLVCANKWKVLKGQC